MTIHDQADAPGLHRTRRGVLGGGAAAGAAMVFGSGRSALAAPPRMPSGPPVSVRFTAALQQLAPNVWAYVQIQGRGESDLLLSNCGLVAGPHSLLAIDTTAAPLQAKAFRAAAEHATGKSFDRVVITHEHVDHVLGLSFFPKVEVIAQENAAKAMATMANSRKPPFWSRAPGWANGDETYVYVQPTRLYKDHLELTYGATKVDLIYPGRAHTLGDTIVSLPAEKIMFLGDIAFFGVAPFNASGYVADWIAVCDRILRMDVRVIVPGHGPVGGKAELAHMRDYLVVVLAGAKKGHAAGLTAGRAAANIDLSKFSDMADPDRVAGNVARIYSELDGTITPEMDRPAADRARTEYLALTAK